jgi:quercetin dioxygenase-like cupin family protein
LSSRPAPSRLCVAGLGCPDYEVRGQHYTLKPGDSLLFRADQPHRWRNPAGEPCLFLMIMTASEEREESLNQHLHP